MNILDIIEKHAAAFAWNEENLFVEVRLLEALDAWWIVTYGAPDAARCSVN